MTTGRIQYIKGDGFQIRQLEERVFKLLRGGISHQIAVPLKAESCFNPYASKQKNVHLYFGDEDSGSSMIQSFPR